MIRVFSCLLLIAAFSLSAYAEDITHAPKMSLPSSLPQLSVTDEAVLGANEENVGVAVGVAVTDFTVNSHKGESTVFSSLYAAGDVMVVFYRGGWCPYCNVQVRQLAEAWPEFKARNITPVLISADKPDAASLITKTYEIPFPVLSDPKLVAHKAFNVVFTLPDELIPVYKDYGIVLEDWSGEGHHQFAVASVFIVDKNGVVKWAHSSSDYKSRPSVEQLLAAIDTL